MSLIRLGILRGGPSDEYDLSLITGSTIRENADKNLYQTVDIFVDKNGVWHIGGAPHQPSDAAKKVDVFFNAIHGQYGEDGKLQSILESLGLPFTGSSALASALTHQKHLAKQRFTELGIKTPYHTVIHIDSAKDIGATALHIFHKFSLPLIIKPVSSGSSYGVMVVKSFIELEVALERAFQYSSSILIEEYISGVEVTSGFIDSFRGQDVYPLIPVEISKALGSVRDPRGKSNHHTPARISEDYKKNIIDAVVKLKDALGLKHSATFDFIVSPKRGVYLLEIDTVPTLSDESVLVSSLQASGVKTSDYIHHLVTLARYGN